MINRPFSISVSAAAVNAEAVTISEKIFRLLLSYRRTQQTATACKGCHCTACRSIHFEKILKAVQAFQPILMVLPAFPGKSPNRDKVLGPLPDYAEYAALNFLANLCQQIEEIYAPGAELLICSDGRVFSDIVGMHETDVSNYQRTLLSYLKSQSLQQLSTFNLDDVYPDYSFLQMRDELMKHYGYSLDYLRYKVKVGARVEAPQDARELNSLYRGITRFLLEDMTYQGQTQSRTQLQKRAKARAYEVIRRSNAWSELIAERFPHAVRLSIHPHFCGSSKLGIRLVADESWMTPWHGVLVETSAGPMLLKRAQAEKIGAQLCFDASGKPSHYRLLSLASPLREVM